MPPVQAELRQESLDSLADEWEALFAVDPTATPFSSPQWALAWWSHWAEGAEPWTIAVREGGELVGLAPLLRRRQGPFQVLGELGRGPGDYWDVLAAPGRREGVLAAVAAEVARRRHEWDALLIDSPHSSDFSNALADAGLRIVGREPLISVEMPLPESFEDYLAGMPRRRRANLRKHLKRLDQGEFSISTVEGGDLPEAIECWHEMRARWWAERGLELDPMHTTGRFRDFIADAVATLVPARLAEVWRFEANGETVGVCVNLVDPRTFYVFLAAFDPAVARLGPGKIQIGHAIRASIEADRELFDFTIGSDDYKYWFGGKEVERLRQVAGSGRVRSRAARAVGALRERRRPAPGG